jgi:hypothetical protein
MSLEAANRLWIGAINMLGSLGTLGEIDSKNGNEQKLQIWF